MSGSWFSRKSQIKKTVQAAGLWRKFVEIRIRYATSGHPPEVAWTRAYEEVMANATSADTDFAWGKGK